MTVYLETSVLLRKLLGEPGSLKDWGHWIQCYTSEITSLESLRALDRLRLQGKMEDAEISEKLLGLRQILATADLITLSRAVLEKASQNLPTIVGTLDAVHLASAIILAEETDRPIIFLTHDNQLAIAAQALGLEIRGIGLAN